MNYYYLLSSKYGNQWIYSLQLSDSNDTIWFMCSCIKLVWWREFLFLQCSIFCLLFVVFVKKLLICKLVFNWKIRLLQTRLFVHNISDDTSEGLPLYFTFLLVVLEKVVIGLEDWQSLYIDFVEESICTEECRCCLYFDDAILDTYIVWSVCNDLRLNWFKCNKSTFFELEQILSIWGATLSIKY